MNNSQSKICELLKENYKNPKCELHFSTPFELLVAVILSAQCTDKRVNEVVKTLFVEANTPEAFAKMKQEELEQKIKSCGFYRNKAKNIISASKDICLRFGSKVPQTQKELESLAGVGEKTASVILAVAFNIPAIAVDTHVTRLSNRLGFVKNLNDPHKICVELKKIIPVEDWIDFHYQLVLHGRYVCKAINPNCQNCFLKGICPSCRGK